MYDIFVCRTHSFIGNNRLDKKQLDFVNKSVRQEHHHYEQNFRYLEASLK